MIALPQIKNRFTLTIALLFSSASIPVFAIEPVSTSEIDALFSDWSGPDTPGAAVGVFLNGEQLYSGAFGMAHLEHATEIDLDTKFNIASVSKTFTAFAVLLLEEQGRLSLVDDIRMYLPEIHEFAEIITIDNLLQHSSGLRNWGTLFALTGVSEDDVVDQADILRLVSRQKELNHSPGDRATYSNTNYFLLSVIVERITGQSFREFTTENIFSPLGMNDTFFSDDTGEIILDRAWGHATSVGTTFTLDMPQHSDVGSSNLLISMNDFAIWEENLVNPKVGSPELLSKLYERGEFNSGIISNYARGTGYGTYRGLRLRGMQGGEPGYRSSRTQFLESGLTIVVLANANFDIFSQFTKIADLYLGDEFSSVVSTTESDSRKFVPISAAELDALAGAYRETDSYNILAAYADPENGSLVLAGSGMYFTLKPTGANIFESMVPSDRTRVEFDTSSAKEIRIIQNGINIFSASEMSSADLTQEDLRQFVGTYHSAELDSSFDIVLRDAGLIRTKVGMSDRKLDSQYSDLFQAEGGTGTMLFERNPENEITGFRLSVANVYNVFYGKQ